MYCGKKERKLDDDSKKQPDSTVTCPPIAGINGERESENSVTNGLTRLTNTRSLTSSLSTAPRKPNGRKKDRTQRRQSSYAGWRVEGFRLCPAQCCDTVLANGSSP